MNVCDFIEQQPDACTPGVLWAAQLRGTPSRAAWRACPSWWWLAWFAIRVARVTGDGDLESLCHSASPLCLGVVSRYVPGPATDLHAADTFRCIVPFERVLMAWRQIDVARWQDGRR